MIAAESVEAINRGDYQLVMGEIHLALNTMNASLRVSQCPRPEELIRALDLDLPEPRLVPVNPKNWAGATARTLPALISAKDFRLVLTPEPHEVPASQAVPIGSLVVEEKDGALVLRSRDGRISYDIIEAFGTALSASSEITFTYSQPESHTPRVTIDRVTVCRETWRFSPSELSFAFEKDEAERFLAARRFARSHDLPRFVHEHRGHVGIETDREQHRRQLDRGLAHHAGRARPRSGRGGRRCRGRRLCRTAHRPSVRSAPR